jgi:hypothetical protein
MKTKMDSDGPVLTAERSYEPLLTRKKLLPKLGITSKKFGELLAEKRIPEIDLGHRTKRYRESAVRKALIKLESEVAI